MSKENSKGLWTYENGLVLMMFIVFGLVFFERLSILYLFPFMAPELGLNNTQVGLVVGVLGIAWGVSTMIFSSISDFIGSKKGMLIIFIFLFGLATFLGGLVGSLATLLLVRAFMGAAEGPVIPLIHSIVNAESTPSRRGFNIGFIQSASSLFGSALAPVIAIGLATAFSWRDAFYLTAIPAFIMGFILMKYLRKPVITTSSDAAQTVKPTRKEFVEIFKRRNVWLGSIIAICNLLFMVGLSTFLPLILTNVSRFEEGVVGMMLGLMGFMFFIGQAIASALSDRIGRKPTLVIFSLVAIFLPVAVTMFYNNFAVLFVCILIFALGLGYQPLIIAIIPAESVPRIFSASAIAAILLLSELIGGTIGPVASGILADQFGLLASQWIPIAAAIVAFLCSFGIQETAPVKLKHRSVKEEAVRA
jgi:MFS family permease